MELFTTAPYALFSRLLQSDVAKAGNPHRASEILIRFVKRE
jgi:hypothetical protein